MRTLVIEADVLDVALAFGAVIGFCTITAVIVGALATSKIPTPLPTPQDYYVGRDDLGHEYLVAVPAESSDPAVPSIPPAAGSVLNSVPVTPSPTADRNTRAAGPASEKGPALHLLGSTAPLSTATPRAGNRAGGPAAKKGPPKLP